MWHILHVKDLHTLIDEFVYLIALELLLIRHSLQKYLLSFDYKPGVVLKKGISPLPSWSSHTYNSNSPSCSKGNNGDKKLSSNRNTKNRDFKKKCEGKKVWGNGIKLIIDNPKSYHFI